MVETFKTLSIGQQERLSSEYAFAMDEIARLAKERDELHRLVIRMANSGGYLAGRRPLGIPHDVWKQACDVVRGDTEQS